MHAIDLDEIAINLSNIVNTLSVRRNLKGNRKDEYLAEYIRNIASLYDEHGYLPQVYPAFAVNFKYYSMKVFDKLSVNTMKLRDSLGDLIKDEVNPKSPTGLIQLTLTASALLCVEASQGHIPETKFRIGRINVSTRGYCSLMRHAHRSTLMLASYTFMDYALTFMAEAISNFISKTGVKECKGCLGMTRSIGSLRGLWNFRDECPKCNEAFRRELTSRTMTAYRGFLASLFGVKWMYNSKMLLGYDLEGVAIPLDRSDRIGGRGVRANYSAIPTYLGRLIAQAIEVWTGRVPDYGAFRGFSSIVGEYLRLFDSFRNEASKVEEKSISSSVYRLRSVSEWHSSVRRITQEIPLLSLVVPTGLGEVVDDLVNYAVNERVHAITASYYAPEVRDSFIWFNSIDYDALLTNRILRAG